MMNFLFIPEIFNRESTEEGFPFLSSLCFLRFLFIFQSFPGDYKGACPFILVGYFSTSNICFLDFVFWGLIKGQSPFIVLL